MKTSTTLISMLTSILAVASINARAQEDVPSPTGAPERDDSGPVTVGTEENQEEGKAVRTKAKEAFSGTGIILIVPSIDAGYLTTSPKSTNIFSKLETSTSGWLVEPKAGLGVFSQKIALDVLLGVQYSSISGKRIGKARNFNDESPNSPNVETLSPEEPYKLQRMAYIIEGDARFRLSNGAFQPGIAASTIFAGNPRLYSSVEDVGVNYAAFVGPQVVYEDRIKDSLFRVFGSVQFAVTGNQRSALNARVGASYALLLNSPYMTVTEKKVVKSRTTIQKKIINTREQTVVENENVTFIFDSQTINFKFNKAELSERSRAFVSGLGQIFSAQRSDWQKLTIEGHTDSKGNAVYNKRLSSQRAEAVKQVLIENGLIDNDITAIGYGKERLLVNPERNEVDFARNRRVEIKVQGLKDARILQRSITRLQNQIFPSASEKKNNEENN